MGFRFTTEQRTRLGRCFVALLHFLNIYQPTMDKRNSVLGIHCANDIHDQITVPELLLSLLLLLSFFLLLLSLFLWSLSFSWCAVLMNTPGLRDPVVMRVLSDFYWTPATGAGLFTSNSAQRHADHCVQVARALCWEWVSLTWIPVGTQCWLLINRIMEISLMQWPEPLW